MPSLTHDGLLELLKENPELLEPLLSWLDVEVPPHDSVVPVSESVGSARSVELRVDGTFLFRRDGEPVLALIVEIQLAIDEQKKVSWPAYAANSRVQFGCRSVVVVLTNSRKVARWARKPAMFPAGTGWYRPVVCGPDEVPRVRNVAAAKRAPYVAALSAIVHGLDTDAARAAATATLALRGAKATLNEAELKRYYVSVTAALSARAREVFDMISRNPEFQRRVDEYLKEEYRRRVREERREGQLEGLARSVLAVFAARRVRVSRQQRKLILDAKDPAVLSRWLKRAVTAPNADALFSN